MSYDATLKNDTSRPEREPLISDVYARCHVKFEELVDIIRNDRHEELKKFADEFAKLKLWAGNMGAMHSGKTYEISLDYRLKQASFYKTQVSIILFLSTAFTDAAMTVLNLSI